MPHEVEQWLELEDVHAQAEALNTDSKAAAVIQVRNQLELVTSQLEAPINFKVPCKGKAAGQRT
jgi:hypothetical protein